MHTRTRSCSRRVAPAAEASFSEAGGGGGAIRGHSCSAFARGRRDPRQPELRRVEAGSVVHGGAHEGWTDLPAVRAPDPSVGVEPGAFEFLPGLPPLSGQTFSCPSRLFCVPAP